MTAILAKTHLKPFLLSLHFLNPILGRRLRTQHPYGPQPLFRRPKGPPGRNGPRGMNTLHTSNSNQLLRVHGVVSHIPNLLCTLDTASAVSMMTVSTARQHGFAIFPSDITIISANNAVTPVVGVTD